MRSTPESPRRADARAYSMSEHATLRAQPIAGILTVTLWALGLWTFGVLGGIAGGAVGIAFALLSRKQLTGRRQR